MTTLRSACACTLVLGALAGCGKSVEGGHAHDGSAAAADASTSDDAAVGDDASVPADASVPPDAAAQPHRCAAFDPNRTLFWGDLHVHTTYSFDANGFGTRLDPAGAYQFAQGQKVTIGGTLTAQLARPLDFAGVTDHSEHFGEYPMGQFTGPDPAKEAWQHEQMAANQANDATPACTFTAFIAYEWTGSSGTGWYHRNVIFGNEHVPEAAISHTAAPTPQQLWAGLAGACSNAGTGCDVVVIPHNSNYSGGGMFNIPDDLSAADAEKRQVMEPLVEVHQHKGNSECKIGVGTMDPLCNFYDNKPADCVATPDKPVCKAGNFVRNALRRGLEIEQKNGKNPLKLGMIADTDTHSATPGSSDEWAYNGHRGLKEVTPTDRLTGDDALNNAGGLTAVWAEERSRGAIFAAMKRRETYATSGTRIALRFFGGFSLPADLCGRPDLPAAADAAGVPMGGDLASAPAGTAPSFVVSALKDPGVSGHPGTKLQHVQIVKGWIDDAGASREKIYEVAGNANNGAKVNQATCATSGPGNDALCAVWKDPDFSPSQRAFYYARVIENPTCSVQQRDCNALPQGSRPAVCTDGSLPMTVQHRAWSSPIWYHP